MSTPRAEDQRLRAVERLSGYGDFRWFIEQRRWWGWQHFHTCYTEEKAVDFMQRLRARKIIYPESYV